MSEDGTVFTFHLRHNAKWQSNKNFKPTRDFNADDVIFSFERQWKDSNPYHKVSGGGYDYFGDMGMPKLLASIDKIDDYTVQVHAEAAERAVPGRPRDGFRLDPVEGIRRCAAEGRQARTDRPGPDRHRPVRTRALPEGRHHPLRAFDGYWGPAPKIDTLVFAITKDPAVRLAKLRADECQMAPYPEPGRPAVRSRPTRSCNCCRSPG